MEFENASNLKDLKQHSNVLLISWYSRVDWFLNIHSNRDHATVICVLASKSVFVFILNQNVEHKGTPNNTPSSSFPTKLSKYSLV